MRSGRFSDFLIVLVVLVFSQFVGCSCVPRAQTAAKDQSSDAEKSNNDKTAKSKDDQSPSQSASSKSEPKSGGSEEQVTEAKSSGGAQESAPASKSGKEGVPPAKGKGSGGSGLGSIAGALFGGSEREERSGLSPEEAHRKASALQRAAIDLDEKGDTPEAFEKALEAWQLVREHKNDAACVSLAQQLEPLLGRLGEGANAFASRFRITGKPLQVE